MKIDINCDMGESFGKYTKGQDSKVMPYITTANIACGFHAGDPHVMDKTVRLAKQHDVTLGAHPGFLDKLGFGRRIIDATPKEVRDYVIYQVGALRAFADANGVPLKHIKPHGALYTLLSENEPHARAVIEGIQKVDTDLIYIATDIDLYEIAKEYSIRTVYEGYVDLDYRDDRSVIIPKEKSARDPELVANRFVEIATNGRVKTKHDEEIEIPAESICIHGDTPNVVEILETIHERIQDTNIELAPIEEVV